MVGSRCGLGIVCSPRAAAPLTWGRSWSARRVPGALGTNPVVGGVVVGGGRALAGGALDTRLLGTCGSSVRGAAQQCSQGAAQRCPADDLTHAHVQAAQDGLLQVKEQLSGMQGVNNLLSAATSRTSTLLWELLAHQRGHHWRCSE